MSSNAPVDDIATALRNTYGDRALIMVSIDAYECPGCDDEMLETEAGDYGKLDDAVWCTVCEWEGTCRELLTG